MCVAQNWVSRLDCFATCRFVHLQIAASDLQVPCPAALLQRQADDRQLRQGTERPAYQQHAAGCQVDSLGSVPLVDIPAAEGADPLPQPKVQPLQMGGNASAAGAGALRTSGDHAERVTGRCRGPHT